MNETYKLCSQALNMTAINPVKTLNNSTVGPKQICVYNLSALLKIKTDSKKLTQM